ncbi:MAG: Ig-like domain-containing protein [Jatrophihabitans sp.]
MYRSRIRRVVPTLLAVLFLVGASTFTVASPAVADTGNRDSQVSVAVQQNSSSSGITVGGQLYLGVMIEDHSGSCINFDDCDNPLGTVDFVLQNADLSYNQTIATLNLSGVVHDASQANVTIDNPLPAGTYHVDAHYNGDPNFHANDGTLDNVEIASLTPDVGIVQSSTSSYQGDPVTFSASVSSPNGVQPTGTVQLVYGMTDIGDPIPLDSSGNAWITRTDLPLSDSSGHTYYFHYSGNYVSSGHGFLNPADSNSIDHQTLTKTPTSTTLSVTSPTRQDDRVDLVGYVSAAGGAQPPGTVTFTASVGGIPFGTASGTLSGGFATATFPASTLFPAPYTVLAQYNPSDPGYAASNASADLLITAAIPLDGVVLAVTASPDPGVLGAPETLHVIATPPAGSTAPVTGEMSFATGATTLGTCSLTAAAACDLITTALPAGVDPITVTYPGSTRYAGVTASTSVTIDKPTPTGTPTSGSPSTHPSSGSTSSTTSGSPTARPSASPSGSPTGTGRTSSTRSGAGANGAGGSGTLAETGVRGLTPSSIVAAALLALGIAFSLLGRRRHRVVGRHR